MRHSYFVWGDGIEVEIAERLDQGVGGLPCFDALRDALSRRCGDGGVEVAALRRLRSRRRALGADAWRSGPRRRGGSRHRLFLSLRGRRRGHWGRGRSDAALGAEEPLL